MRHEPPPHPDARLSYKELADALGRSTKYVQRMRRRGLVFKLGRVSLAEVDAWFKSTMRRR